MLCITVVSILHTHPFLLNMEVREVSLLPVRTKRYRMQFRSTCTVPTSRCPVLTVWSNILVYGVSVLSTYIVQYVRMYTYRYAL